MEGVLKAKISVKEGNNKRSVDVAQLVDRLLPTPEIRTSNPVIGKIYRTINSTKTKIKKKRPVMTQIKKHKRSFWMAINWLMFRSPENKENQKVNFPCLNPLLNFGPVCSIYAKNCESHVQFRWTTTMSSAMKINKSLQNIIWNNLLLWIKTTIQKA